jgi:hypothetical protein
MRRDRRDGEADILTLNKIHFLFHKLVKEETELVDEEGCDFVVESGSKPIVPLYPPFSLDVIRNDDGSVERGRGGDRFIGGRVEGIEGRLSESEECWGDRRVRNGNFPQGITGFEN